MRAKRQNIETVYELSPMQRGMLFHTLYSPDSGVYVVQFSAELRGELDVRAFEQAWRHVVGRHAVLRTSFHWRGLEKPVQVVHRRLDIALDRISWRGLTPEQRAGEWRRHLAADRERGFELESAPLLRLALFELEEGAHRFLWTSHHLYLDGWSNGLVLKEVFESYRLYAAGKKPRLARARPFKHYISWLQKKDAAQAERFWRDVLAGFDAPTLMSRTGGFDQERLQDDRQWELELPEELSGELMALARRRRLTLNTLVQGAWARLLSSYGDADDLVFGATTSGRPAELRDVESMVGLFINTLPIRAEVSPPKPLFKWLERLQAHQAELRKHEHHPLELIQKCSELAAGTPLFDHILVFENFPVDAFLTGALPELEITAVRRIESTNYPLTIAIFPQRTILFRILYDGRHFDGVTIRRLACHLSHLLAAFRSVPAERRLDELTFLSPAEHHQLSLEANDVRAPDVTTLSAETRLLHELWAASARRAPDATALVQEGNVPLARSYGELARRVRRLAELLRRRGVGPEVVVGIAVERPFEVVEGLLAILEAGGVYLPLDPSFPPERLVFMLRDAGARLFLTWGKIGDDLAAGLGAAEDPRRLRLEDLAETLTDEGIEERTEESVENGVRPDNLAYLIYTSGSTGTPKGVASTHGQIFPVLRWSLPYFELGGHTRVLQNLSYSFDFGLFELVTTLLGRGTLFFPRPERRYEPAHLAELIPRHELDTVHATPSFFRQIAAVDRPLPSLAIVHLGGEPVSRSLVRAIDAVVGESCRIYNGYGPTETAVNTAIFRLAGRPRKGRAGGENLPIGRVTSRNALYVLDRYGQPGPVGVGGELYVGGEGVARGYLGRPGLTAERFLPDPRSAPGGRLYRTGDLVRTLEDGNIEFLGRTDHQIKLRGFRLELGEIEAALLARPEIREAAVLADGRGPSGEARRLVAYVTGESHESEVDVGELRRSLRRDLPAPMVPAAFVVLESFPRTPSGKLDRRALPAPDGAARSTSWAPPRSPLEEMLAAIFAEVLGHPEVGIHDNFFELGGHSLRATQLVSRVRESLETELALRALFEAPTVAELAAVVERERATNAARPPLEKIPPRDRRGPLPLSFAQERLWLLQQLDPESAAYHIPTVVRFSGTLDKAALDRAVSEVVRRHQALRTSFTSAEDGAPRQVVAAWRPMVSSRIDLVGIPEEGTRQRQVRRAALDVASRPFDLGRAPLLRAALVRTAAAEHVAILVVHHIVSDGWSSGIFLRELSFFYRAFAETPRGASGSREAPPELPVQYPDFAVWQRRWLAGRILTAELEHWRAKLASSVALDLPTDRPRPPVMRFVGASHHFSLPAKLVERVRALARGQRATLFMTFLAVFQALCHRLSGQADVAVGTPVAGRQDRRIENLIGFFVNMLVLRTDLSGRPSLRELLGRVRETCLEAYAHQDVPFEKLVEELQPERDLARSPLFQVAFALHNASSLAPEPTLKMEPIAFETGTAKFDLTLDLYERPGEAGRQREMGGRFEYRTDLFDPTTIARLEGHFRHLLQAALAEENRPLGELALLSAAQSFQITVEWNDTASGPPAKQTIHQLFELQAARRADAVAAIFDGSVISYGELERRCNQLARHLLAQGYAPGTRIGISIERSVELLVALLGTLKAGMAYVPLEPGWPEQRQGFILGSLEVPCLLTSGSRLRAVHDLRWRVPSLREVVLLDVLTAEPPPEPFDTGEARELWDHVAERAVDEITAGGFVSSYTGQAMSPEEVAEYRDRVLELAAPYLGPRQRVLEIGCGSGLILFELARRAGLVVGVDPSPFTQERNREELARRGLENVELVTAFAHELTGLDGEFLGDSFEKGSFDLVVLASTIQFFPGPAYLRAVLGAVLELLAPTGAVLAADVLDARRKDDFRRSLEQFRARHGGEELQTKSRFDELYLDEDVFADLLFDLPDFVDYEIFHRRSGFDNELGFRYDAVLRKAPAPGVTARKPPRRQKRLHTRKHLEALPADAPCLSLPPEAIAYVIFTSGSTGRPKGVVVQHLPALNLIEWVNATFRVGTHDRMLFVTSPCFDLSVYDVFGILGAGGSVRIATPEELADPARLARLMTEAEITFWDSAPAALQQLVPFFPEAGGETLRLVFSSGDWIPVTLPDRVRAVFPRARPIALGGATEATIWSNYYPVGEIDPGWPSIPYGRPIRNAEYRVLDAGFEPCVIGVAGDLYIGGECLALGYAEAPATTAAKFLPDPFGHRSGGRLYQTGDQARFFASGNLEFLGRRDRQVKIRGFRIELGEIEAALTSHPAVSAAVAKAWVEGGDSSPARSGDRRLVAYWVGREGLRTGTAELRELLRRKLPEAMLPAAFMELESIPLTANGKVDLEALPAPQWTAGRSEEDLGAPRTPTEELLVEVFQEVLGVERIGTETSFFDLGGHSLLATRVVARTRQLFAVELPMRAVFEAPTVAALAAHVDTVRGGAAVAPPLLPVPREGTDLPLSFGQERLWFLDALMPGSALYNMPATLELRGPLDPRALERAFQALVDRHESLRTTFSAQEGPARQRIAARQTVDFARSDLCALPDAARSEAETRLIAAHSSRPFDLARGPLLRVRLIRTAPERHVLVVVLHHIVGDGWSFDVLRRELAAAYRAFAAGRPPALPELPLQYADWAVWQRQWLRGKALEDLLTWWTEHLAGLPGSLELPYDQPPATAARPRRPTAARFRLAEGAARPLRALARRRGATLSMTLLTAFQILLGRYSGRSDVAVGLAVANRRHVETEGLIGFFVNTLVQRTDLGGDPSFDQAMARVRHTSLEIEARQELPFERLVEALAPERSLERNPLVQVMFSFQNASREALDVEGLRVAAARQGVDPGTSKFDLTLAVDDLGAELHGTLEYDPALFQPSTVRRLAGHFQTLLGAAAAAPQRAVSSLPLLSAAQRQQLLREWNAHGEGNGADGGATTVLELFAARVERAPDALALVCGPRCLTYGELDARASRLAARLGEAGIGPETFVGVCLERSPDWLVAILGVLAARGAYLPLDPEYPRERLAGMLEDSDATVVLTDRRSRGSLPASPRVRLLVLDGEEELRGASGPRSVRPARPEHAAYMIYTSGSTGRPKGVVISHRALGRLVAWHRRVYATGPEDRATQLASVAFDASVWEIWPYLTSGARLVVAPQEIRLDPPRLGAWMAREGITLSFLPTPLAEALLTAGEVEIPSLRALLTGGDRLRPVATHGLRLINHYGPTESTVVASAGAVSWGPPRALPSIGRPLPHTPILLLDPHLQPVPPGVGGELCIGGEALARGYWRRPAVTAASFVPHPTGAPAGGRLYRTGDLCRWRPDGQLDFLGRIDHQVKIRGRRVELGEIESILARHEAVAQAAAALHESRGEGAPRLVAYVVARPSRLAETSDDLDVGSLRELLEARLPSFMVPTSFVTLDKLPLTPNGKLDRRALPPPAPAAGREDRPGARPSPVEEEVAALYEEILGVERVGPGDDFFALGGHSLLATRLAARLRDAFGVEMPVRSLFERPTVDGLAAGIEARLGSAAGEVPAPPLEREPRAADVVHTAPLSFAQERLWFLSRFDPASAAHNMPFAVRWTGRLELAALGAGLAALARRHESLRTTFVQRDGRPAQRIAPATVSATTPRPPLVDLMGLPAAQREAEGRRLAAEEARRPFDLERGPLWRCTVARLSGEQSLLLATMHHIVSDGVSIGIFLRELTALYRSFLEDAADRGAANPWTVLPALPVQYADYVHWQRRWLSSRAPATARTVLEAQLEYWRQRLEGLPDRLELPADRPRPAVRSVRGKALTRPLSPALCRQLRELGRGAGTTLFMTLLAAFDVVLARLAGVSEIVVGTPVAGRRHSRVEGLIGCFLNHLVLRTDLSGDPPFRELLERVRKDAIGAYTHQDVPFEKLLEALRPERDLSRTPLFQVFFNMLEPAGEPVQVPGAQLEPVAGEAAFSPFDLTLYLAPQGRGEEATVSLDLVYSAELFERRRMVEFLGQYEHLLAQIAARPETRISAFSLRTPAAAAILPDPRQELDSEWHGAIHELVARQAARAPTKTALIDPTAAWTYGELHAASARLADRLVAADVGRGGVVAIWAHRSASLAVAVLGVLEAGAAFLLLDPTYPPARVVELLRRSRPRAWVRLRRAGALPEELLAWLRDSEIARFELPEEDEGTARDAPRAPARAPAVLGPEDLACLAFTSGSTGVPKAILGRHGPLSHFLPWQRQRFELDENDRFGMLSALSHDPLQRDLFTPLALGATLLIPDPERMFEPGHLAAWLCREEVSVVHLTPAMGQLLAERPADGARQTTRFLRRIFLVGDVLTRRDVARLAELAPSALVVNLYGSTETQRAVAYHVVERDHSGPETRGREVLPLGRGMRGVQLLIRGPGGELAGLGEVGEIAVRSPHLARGYLDDDTASRERFQPNPFTSAPPAWDRVYLTGDLGRYLPDGDVVFAGRRDQQVKIRGFRVELGEIEARLESAPEVERAAVIHHDPGEGSPRLVAFVKLRRSSAEMIETTETARMAGELRRFLEAELPAYMIPAAFVALETFPLTPNAKLDRRALHRRASAALAEISHGPSRAASGGVAPRDRVEWELAQIWEELLDVSPLGVRDDFFELGGHSLLAVRLLARIEQRFGSALPVAALFRGATIEKLALALREPAAPREAGGEASVLVELSGRGKALEEGVQQRPLFCVHPVGGSVLCYRELARHLGPEQPLYGLQAPGLEDGEAPLPDIGAMAVRYAAAIRSVTPRGPYRLGGWSFGAWVALEIAQRLQEAGEEVQLLALIDPPEYHESVASEDATTSLMNAMQEVFPFAAGDFQELSRDAQIDHFVEQMRAAELVPPDFGPDRARRLLRLYTHNMRLGRRFEPRPYAGRVHLFLAADEPRPLPGDLGERWRDVAAGGVEIEIVPGDHRTLVASPNVEILAERLSAVLKSLSTS